MDGIRIERRGATLELTIDRPKANAIDSATSKVMGEAFVALPRRPRAAGRDRHRRRRALLLGRLGPEGLRRRGPGRSFGAGGLGGLTELFDLEKPVIAAVNGYAAGGGFELALACDMVVAVPGARFSLPEVKLGLIADSGGMFRLPRRMPRAPGDGDAADRRADRRDRGRPLGPGQPGCRATNCCPTRPARLPPGSRPARPWRPGGEGDAGGDRATHGRGGVCGDSVGQGPRL